MKTTPLRQRFIEHLVIRGYAPRTIESYVMYVALLARFHNRSPERLSNEEIRAFLLWLHLEKKYSYSSINVCVNALRYFYAKMLDRPIQEVVATLPRPRRTTRRPQVYSTDELKRLFEFGYLCPKNRVIGMTLYGAGLRISEALQLKAEHIDPERHIIRVELGKGRKDRNTFLPDTLVVALRAYWKAFRPHPWLFPSRLNRAKPVGATSVQKTFARAVERAGLPHKGGPHVLRHCFATHMIESGTPLHVVKRFLGHRNATTTAGYLHITQETIDALKSPFDRLGLRF